MSSTAVLTLRQGSTDAIVAHQIFVTEIYKPVRGLADFALIIDGGANGGFSTVWFEHHFPRAKIVAIEPDPRNFAVLKSNAEKCSSRNIQLEQCALWSSWSNGQMVDGGGGEWALQVKEGGECNVDMIPLGAWLGARPCLVKLDIEGAETELFRHPGWMVLVDVIAVELHDGAARIALNAALSASGRPLACWTVGETTFVHFMEP